MPPHNRKMWDDDSLPVCHFNKFKGPLSAKRCKLPSILESPEESDITLAEPKNRVKYICV